MSKFANKLEGKRIIVVGGSAGIGYGAAQALAELGTIITVISSSQENVTKAVQSLKQSTNSQTIEGRVADVRNEEAFTKTLLELAPVDHIVFSSVDKIIRGSLKNANLDDAKFFFGVKFWGSIVVGKAIAKHDIVRPGGSLTLTSGTAALRPGNAASIGSALNGGILSLTKGLAGELAEKKIRVNTVVPGLVKTGLWDKLGLDEERKKVLVENGEKELPVGFVATPEDIAEAYVYLIRANYATGTLVEIDGGRLLV